MQSVSLPSSSMIVVCPISRYSILDISNDGFLTLMNEDCTEERCDIRVDPASEIGSHAITCLNAGNELVAVVAKVDGRDLVSDIEIVKPETKSADSQESMMKAEITETREDKLRAHAKELCAAVALGDIAKTRKLLNSDLFDVNRKASKKGWVPLNIALYEGNSEIAALLLEYQPRLDERTDDGATSLHLAVDKCDVDIVRVILKSPVVDVDVADFNGWTSLHVAANNGRFDMVRALVEEGNANVNSLTKGNWNALHAAANGGHEDVCLLLLAFGTDVTQVNDNGLTPIGQAERAEKKSIETVFKDPFLAVVEADNVYLANLLFTKAIPIDKDATGMNVLKEFSRSDEMRKVLELNYASRFNA